MEFSFLFCTFASLISKNKQQLTKILNMKIYIYRQHYNFCGLNGNVYSICTHRTKCIDNREFLQFEKRNGTWMLWDNWKKFIGLESPTKMESLKEVLSDVRISISNQIKHNTNQEINPDDIEFVGLSKILED